MEDASPTEIGTDWARWSEIDALFEALLDLDPAAWDDALDDASPDAMVRRTVLRLLHATREPQVSGLSLPKQAAADAIDALGKPQVPETIGPFRPIRELGSGGMGTVYLAERADGEFRQQVAIKVLRRGLDTDHLLARFRTERRILAGIRHPNVAHLIDGGSIPDGRPWLAMEYVEGVPIDTYCSVHRLNERARVRLVRDASAAVREVHRNLVVHRDIKPSNVLVTAEGVPKLLDFGIAKLVAAGDELGDHVRTHPGHLMLTPRYAAPEQRNGRPVTAATDVYQLGLLLQEVLAGGQGGDPNAPGVRGDLRRVVAKATHDDPLRRYRDAGALVEELDLWLEGRPIAARPDTLTYRTARFLQRHRWVAPAAALSIILLGGWGRSLVKGAESLREERDRAQSAAERALIEQDRAESATTFLVDLFRSADPSGGERGDTLSARTLITRGATRIREGDDVDPAVGASLLMALGEVAQALGMFAEASDWSDAGIALATRAYGPSSPELASLLHARANFLNGHRDFAGAAVSARHALEIRRTLPNLPADTLAASLLALSVALAEVGETAEAREAAREAMALYTQAGTEGSPGHIAVLSQLAYAARRAGDDAEAEAQYLKLLQLQPGGVEEFRRARAINANNLAQLLKGQGRLAEAEPYLRESLEILRTELDASDRTLSVAFNNLAALLVELERPDEAVSIGRAHLDLMRATFPEDHWRVASAHGVVATILERAGLWLPAEADRAAELRIYSVALGPDHSWTTQSRIRHAKVLAELGRMDEAMTALRAARASILRIDDISDPSALDAEVRELAERIAGNLDPGI